MNRLFPLIAAAAALLPASAPATGGSTAAVFEAGRCMVQRDRRAAISLFRSLPLDQTVADFSALGGSAARACIGAVPGASGLLVRGAIAQALFQRDFRGEIGDALRNGVQPADLGLPDASAGGAPNSWRWADCVVRNEPAATGRLLRTEVGSPQEAAAISGLQLHMSACMAMGAELTLRRSEVRSLFAQGAYHNAYRYWAGQLRAAPQ